MKKQTNLKKVLLYFSCAGLLFSSCQKDNTTTGTNFSNGVFISNEGGFGNNNASVSYYDYDADSLQNNVFKKVNGYSPGDVLQSIHIVGRSAYLVVNNSNKVIVANVSTLKESDEIVNMPQPRYMLDYQGRGYVTCWGDNSVHVVNLSTNVVIDSISVGSGPEHMLIHNGQLFVANSGGFGSDSTVTVIDLSTQKVVKTLDVGDNPQDIKEDKNGDLWVLCHGIEAYSDTETSTPAKLVQLDGVNLQIKRAFTLTNFAHPSVLGINAEKDTLYFCDTYSLKGIYELPINGTTAKEFCSDQAYGFTVIKSHNEIFVMVAPSFTGPGILKRYNSSGKLLGSYLAGIGPNGGISLKDAKEKIR